MSRIRSLASILKSLSVTLLITAPLAVETPNALWRQGFAAPALPVAVVQLPEYNGGPDWARLQADQAAVQGLDHASLVSAQGLGEMDNIHPTRKAELGQRLCDALLKAVHRKASSKP